MSKHYFLYNLNVQSEILLPAPAANLSAEPTVSVGLDFDLQVPASLNKDNCFDVNRSIGYFYYKDVGSFCIRNGNHISVKPAPNVDDSFLSVSSVGTPMGILFYQRGCFVMHGSAVNINGKAYVFLGESRAGKSTAALTLVSSGYPLLTDDVVVIEQDVVAGPLVTPSFSWVKVDQKVAINTGIAPSRLESIAPGMHKHLFELTSKEFCRTPLPLGGIFILAWGQDFGVEEISAREAMIHITPFSYGPAPRTKYPDDTTHYFGNAAALIDIVPCYKLIRPYDLDRLLTLPEVVGGFLNSL